MSITRINEFRAVAGSSDLLRDDFIKSLVPLIEASADCLSCQLLQSQKDPHHIILIEVWDSVEAHQASLKNVPPEIFHQIRVLLAVPPTGEYYEYCHS